MYFENHSFPPLVIFTTIPEKVVNELFRVLFPVVTPLVELYNRVPLVSRNLLRQMIISLFDKFAAFALALLSNASVVAFWLIAPSVFCPVVWYISPESPFGPGSPLSPFGIPKVIVGLSAGPLIIAAAELPGANVVAVTEIFGVTPIAPVSPLSPFSPCGPCGPVLPVSPRGPVRP